MIADENIPRKTVEKLREEGFAIISITETRPGIDDIEIIDLATQEQGIIATFDKDFGDIVFLQNKPSVGILLLRFSPPSPDYIAERIMKALTIISNIDENVFTVVEDDKLRIRKLNKP